MSDEPGDDASWRDGFYVCRDDEGNSFVYVGPDTFTRLSDGPEKERWMRKLGEGKVTISEVGALVLYDGHTGEFIEERLLPNWEYGESK